MTWEWSHSPEAHRYAREQVGKQPHEWLETVYAEWNSRPKGMNGHSALSDFSEAKFRRALRQAKKLLPDVLADYIWLQMEAQADCTNGGWQAHCCPYGCLPHMAPFAPEEEP